MATYKTGDVFSLQLPDGTYTSGHIVLDVRKQCVRPKKIDANSSLDFFDGTLLVDIYKHVADEPVFEPAERLIAGMFVMNRFLKSGQWPIIDHVDVDPKAVEFPETLANVQGRLCFQRGEVVLPFSRRSPSLDTIEIFPTMHRPVGVPMVCYYYLHREGLIEHIEKDQARDLKIRDLRFTEHRSEIYALLDNDEDQSYYEMSLKHGYDVTRFYES
jgi:hypothetical protein